MKGVMIAALLGAIGLGGSAWADGTQSEDETQASCAQVDAGKNTAKATLNAYKAVKHAIIRCGAKGDKLPLEKYAQWQSIELTFNPERMSLR